MQHLQGFEGCWGYMEKRKNYQIDKFLWNI